MHEAGVPGPERWAESPSAQCLARTRRGGDTGQLFERPGFQLSAATPDVIPAPRPMLHALAKAWWLVRLRGIASILFGILAFVWPGLTLVTLIMLYGAYALVAAPSR